MIARYPYHAPANVPIAPGIPTPKPIISDFESPVLVEDVDDESFVVDWLSAVLLDREEENILVLLYDETKLALLDIIEEIVVPVLYDKAKAVLESGGPSKELMSSPEVVVANPAVLVAEALFWLAGRQYAVKTSNAELTAAEFGLIHLTQAPPDIISDATAELTGVKQMQFARAVGIVVELHKIFEKSSAALLTALAAHCWRLE